MKPIHPMLVHFPIALLALAVAADLVAFFTTIESLRSTGRWSLAGAAATGVVTVLAGVYDMKRANITEEMHERGHRHMKVGFALVTVIVGLAIWRWIIFRQAALAVSAIYLDCAVLTVALALFQGWLGVDLVYTYGVFVDRAAPSTGADGNAGSADKTSSHHH